MIALPDRFQSMRCRVVALLSLAPIAIALFGGPARAADPFRSENPRAIGDQTEAAFRALFERGNYLEAERYLKQAEGSESAEPMVYALQATLAYQDENWDLLRRYADRTLETAIALTPSDPLRGNLYQAIGHFLDGAHTVATQGTLRGAPRALEKLQTVLQFMNVAEQLDPDDPELNLLKGYMDLFLGLNLPFSDPITAVNRLDRHAEPRYLARWGMALAYRDLDQLQRALNLVNEALQDVPDQPELFYLKAQILGSLAKEKNNDPQLLNAAQTSFAIALARSQQLPKRTVAQMFYEQCKLLVRIDSRDRPCDPLRDTIKESEGLWGPVQLPPI